MTEAKVALSIRALGKAYDGAVAIDAVDLDVHAGELVTLLGPSGSGKTTLLMSIAGFAEPDAGRIVIDGRDISNLPPHKRDIGVVFQQYALFPHLTIEDNVAYPLRVRGMPSGERRDAVARALALVRLEGYARRRPAQLSGGQQQRVALARALVFKPPVLLMDEPLGALDRKLRAQMQLEIRTIQRSLGITTVYVTHDQEEALAISDRIAVMHAGRLRQIGTPESIYRRPSSTFVADFIGDSNLFSGSVDEGEGGTALFRASGGLVFPLADAPRTAAREYVAMLRPEDVRVARARSDICPYPGVVRELVYLGSTARMQIDVDARATVHATVAAHAMHELPAPGEQIWFGWRTQPVLVPPP